MPFKNKQTGYYYTEIRIDGYGKLPRLSLRTKRKRDARLIEDALRDLGRKALVRPRLYDLLDALKPQGRGQSGDVSPARILRAKSEKGGYERLLKSLNDPPLPAVLDAYVDENDATREDEHARGVLMEYVGDESYSFLLEGQNVQALLEKIEEGEDKKRASVHRYEKRLISKLIRWRSGSTERNRVFDEVSFSPGDDTRRLRMRLVDQKIPALLDELKAGYYKEGDELAPLYVRVALSTGATVGPLSRTKNADLSEIESDGERWGKLMLRGTKKVKTSKGHRNRPILILPALWTQLRTYVHSDEPEAEAFPLAYSRFYTIWKKAVKRAGLESAAQDGTRLRPHDLRSVFSWRAERAGLERTKIGIAGLGHSDLSTTDRYLSNEVLLTPSDMRQIKAA